MLRLRAVRIRALRDYLRKRFPGVFAFYKRHIRALVARRDSHYAIARWVNQGFALRSRMNLADICIDREGAWFIDSRGLHWRFDPEIWGSTLGAATGFVHESPELEAICKRLGHLSVVVDVGANIGTFAIPVMRTTAARIIAIEPASSTFRLLNDNVRRNKADHAVTTIQAAIGEVAGNVVITTDSQSANYVLSDQDAPRTGQERVPLVTLDTLLMNESQVDFIKVDVEGFELNVMRGARETLARHAPAVLLEVESRWTARFGYRPEDIFAFMAEAGYTYQTLASEGAAPPTSLDADLRRGNNFLFVPAQA